MDRYLQSPGYDPEWGQPIKGGTYIFGAQRDGTTFYANNQGCCYYHGCYYGLPWSSLFRIDAWTGDLTAIEGDLVESWEMSDDGLTLTMQLQQGVMFFDEMAEESIVPAEYDGGQILGDEFVCEDAVASAMTVMSFLRRTLSNSWSPGGGTLTTLRVPVAPMVRGGTPS